MRKIVKWIFPTMIVSCALFLVYRIGYYHGVTDCTNYIIEYDQVPVPRQFYYDESNDPNYWV